MNLYQCTILILPFSNRNLPHRLTKSPRQRRLRPEPDRLRRAQSSGDQQISGYGAEEWEVLLISLLWEKGEGYSLNSF